jgi:hypothetical protein
MVKHLEGISCGEDSRRKVGEGLENKKTRRKTCRA